MAGSKDAGLDMARRLASTSAQIVVYKMGEHGAVTCHKGVELRTGVYTVDAVKPTGAGDSFMAGFLTSIANGHDLHTALLRGSACAAIVVGKPGCAPAMPYPDELDTFLTNHPGPTQVA
jgi:5-dehydro-2-deoxygluconokinase